MLSNVNNKQKEYDEAAEKHRSLLDIEKDLILEIFIDQRSRNQTYATCRRGKGVVNIEIMSSDFKDWLKYEYFKANEGNPDKNELAAFVEHLNTKAKVEGKAYPIHVRTAQKPEGIYVDLGNDEGTCILIDQKGWKACDVPMHVKFLRFPDLLPLPMPVLGGNLDEWRSLLNLQGDETWLLLLAWMIGCYFDTIVFPILVLNGPERSGKTFAVRMVKALVDPANAASRNPPESEQDLFIAASRCRLLPIDNLSSLSRKMSDAYCRFATGASNCRRTLHTNRGETIIYTRAHILLNGIPDFVERSDLADRCIKLEFVTLPETKQRLESEIEKLFEDATPRILGAFFTLLSDVLRLRDDVVLAPEEMGRMAGYAQLGAAMGEALGVGKSAFLGAYLANRSEASECIVDGSPLALLILAFVAKEREWRGSSHELMRKLQREAKEAAKRGAAWNVRLPKDARALTSELKRLARVLNKKGLYFTSPRRTKAGREIVLTMKGGSNSSALLTPLTPLTPDDRTGNSGAAYSAHVDADQTLSPMTLQPPKAAVPESTVSSVSSDAA